MEIARLVLEYVKVLAWPFVVVVLAVLFRLRLAGLVDRVSSVEAMGTNVRFVEKVGTAQQALDEVRDLVSGEATRPPTVVRQPEIAVAARRVLDDFPIWPQFYRSGLPANAQIGDAWQELSDLVRAIAERFVDVDRHLDKMNNPVRVLQRLADVTGVPGWREVGLAIQALDPDQLRRESERYDFEQILPPSLVSQIASLVVGPWSKRRRQRIADRYLDTIGSAMAALRGLLEATASAHYEPNLADSTPHANSGSTEG